jgi:Fic family protein
MLFETPELGAPEERVLVIIRDLWRDLRRGLAQRRRKWTGLLARNLRAKAIRGSNSIEGYLVSEEAAIAALEGEKPEDTDETSWINVVHYREAMDYVLQLHEARDFAYTKELLKSLHFMMMRHRTDKHPGLWRPGAVYVRNEATGDIVYEGPPADVVPELAQELCEQLSKDDEVVATRMIRAAMAHLNLVMIHPFSDGNGRMARCLQTLVLARGGVLAPAFSSIEEYLGRNHQAYYDVLAVVGGGHWERGGDARPWVRFCLTAHYRQARSVARRLDHGGLPDRAGVAVVNAALGYKLRNEDYRRDADISTASATRDLKALSDADILVPKGERRGRTYVASSKLLAIAARYANRARIEDPFDLV